MMMMIVLEVKKARSRFRDLYIWVSSGRCWGSMALGILFMSENEIHGE